MNSGAERDHGRRPYQVVVGSPKCIQRPPHGSLRLRRLTKGTSKRTTVGLVGFPVNILTPFALHNRQLVRREYHEASIEQHTQ